MKTDLSILNQTELIESVISKSKYYGVSSNGMKTLLSQSDIIKSSKKFIVIPERVSKSTDIQKVICKLSTGKEIVMDVFDQTNHSGDWTVTFSVEGTSIKSARPANYYMS